MTQTASFKEKLKTAFSFFKWEFKACSGTLVVYTILAAVFTTITLTLCLAFNNYTGSSSNFADAIKGFGYVSSNIIYFLTIIFTIIYTIRVYSYLHNKRKADLYGSLPVSRITLFLSKSATAFIFSLVPALFFLGIISIITVCFGQPVIAEVSAMYLKLIMGSLACISAYGLLAVCCGTSINAVMMFIVVCIVYPLSAIFIRGVAGGFFDGFYPGILQDNFIMNALNPLAAYDGINIIYWIIFSVVCIVSGCYLVKRRKYERAQSSFAYYLPCHIIKVLVAFLAGMFLGVLFGSLNVFNYGYAGFVFGFILGSVPAFIISHLIFYTGFKKLLKTSIPLGGLIVVVVGLMAICNFDVFGYNDCIPHIDNVAKAGFVDLEHCYNNDDLNAKKLADECCDDFSNKDTITDILTLHSGFTANRELTSDEKFVNVWYKMFADTFSFDSPRYCFGYTLNNGRTIKRVYSENMFDSSYYYDDDLNAVSIIYTDEYFKNYGVIYNADKENISKLTVATTRYYSSEVLNYRSDNDNDALEDANKILNAFRKDFDADKVSHKAVLAPLRYSGGEAIEDFEEQCPDAVCVLTVGVSGKDIDYSNPFSVVFLGGLFEEPLSEQVVIPKSYTNTIKALKETGILNDKLTLNENSEYYKGYDDGSNNLGFDYLY